MAAALSSPVAPNSIIPLQGRSPAAFVRYLLANILNALRRLDLTLSPAVTIRHLRRRRWSLRTDYGWILFALEAVFCLWVMQAPAFPLKLLIPAGYALITLVPFLGQFFVPGSYVLAWVLLFFSSKDIPVAWRPAVHVALLPTLESVLYGANISDILTRYTHPVLDIIAWLPYGLLHFVIPFVIAAVAFVFGPRGSINFWGKAFGIMNLVGVITQILLPCTPPWYELIHGLTPAYYGMKGSAGGLSRIDAIFGGNGYTVTFSNAPIPFGAFPSLHSGSATIEALFLSHFFPRFRPAYWAYVAVLYWSTMYLTHHYLIDLVAGGCLATFCFYFFMPAELKEWESGGVGRFEEYDLVDHPRNGPSSAADEDDDEHGSLDSEIRKLEEGAASLLAAASSSSAGAGPSSSSATATAPGSGVPTRTTSPVHAAMTTTAPTATASSGPMAHTRTLSPPSSSLQFPPIGAAGLGASAPVSRPSSRNEGRRERSDL